MKDLGHHRKSYEKSALTEDTIPDNPLFLFKQWFHEFEDLEGSNELNPMTLATIGQDGFPKSRIVLLKKFSEEGFTFFTNYNSEKGRSIASNPQVCLSFFWETMERQVIIKGIARKTSEAESDAYFATRPLGSRLGAVASNQSEVVESREFLDKKLQDLEMKIGEADVARPKHWGGYLVEPQEMEFWQGRANRMHDRILYRTINSIWTTRRLSP